VLSGLLQVLPISALYLNRILFRSFAIFVLSRLDSFWLTMIVVLGATGNMGSITGSTGIVGSITGSTGIGFILDVLAGVGILAGDTDTVGFGFIFVLASNTRFHPLHLTSIVHFQ
jgi:hypothetical protein